MSSVALIQSGLRPLPELSFARDLQAHLKKPIPMINGSFASLGIPSRGKSASGAGRGGSSVGRHWGLMVSAPLRVAAPSGGEEDAKERKDPSSFFDPGAPPPFTLAQIREAIPKHCWVKDTWKSMSYVFRDVAIVFGLAGAAAFFNNWMVWPLYWVAQGTMFWALFVLGHDCGHGSFSNSRTLNSVMGHLLHSTILVPFHGCSIRNRSLYFVWSVCYFLACYCVEFIALMTWNFLKRISHRTHHQNHGHVENDESWHPLSETFYKSLDDLTKLLRFTAPFPMLAFPIYLWTRSPGKNGSHFHPKSDLFVPSEKNDVIVSAACWGAMAALLVGLSFWMGPVQMLQLYGVPYLISVMWLDFVTYLHHHGHEEKLPWYRGKEWSYLRGGLTTIDRDYGIINNIHHDIGTHVIHHLFPQIPHYHLVEATKEVKSVLGKYYREPKKSGPIPFHLVGSLIQSLGHDHFVSDDGDVVYYQTDPLLNGSKQDKSQ